MKFVAKHMVLVCILAFTVYALAQVFFFSSDWTPGILVNKNITVKSRNIFLLSITFFAWVWYMSKNKILVKSIPRTIKVLLLWIAIPLIAYFVLWQINRDETDTAQVIGHTKDGKDVICFNQLAWIKLDAKPLFPVRTPFVDKLGERLSCDEYQARFPK